MKKRSLLRTLRAASEPKVTQYQVARLAGVSQARYWQIENGVGSEPSDGERDAVAAALGVQVADIAWPVFTAKAKAS